MVLPGADTLPLAAWENLARFVRERRRGDRAGRAAGQQREANSPPPGSRTLAKEIFGESGAGCFGPQVSRTPASTPPAATGVFLPRGLESLLPLVLDGLLEPDVKVAERKSPLRVTHRRLDDREVYFVINDSAKPWTGEVEFAAAGRRRTLESRHRPEGGNGRQPALPS